MQEVSVYRTRAEGAPVISQTAEYALRTVLQIAEQGDRDHPVGAADIARSLTLPANYISKTLHALARAGVLTSTRGKRGGFRLARPAGEILLLDVVAPFDHIGQQSVCLLGRPECSDRSPCAAHERWKATQAGILVFFRQTTIADLLATRTRRRP